MRKLSVFSRFSVLQFYVRFYNRCKTGFTMALQRFYGQYTRVLQRFYSVVKPKTVGFSVLPPFKGVNRKTVKPELCYEL